MFKFVFGECLGYLGVSWGRPGVPKAYFHLPEVKTHPPEARHDTKHPSNIQKYTSGQPKFRENIERCILGDEHILGGEDEQLRPLYSGRST